ncbi:hypothetical protein BDN70DRAFT_939082 [Pholiota conissans]|uniref:Uncharacterized protein n=1 Tax=Pholiota conissans TaxID=109636 RepID=A0A9P5YLC8_9AGAR|nr:hypothetical protein BDN70DRAFT_939082 [Pholiota conissans]
MASRRRPLSPTAIDSTPSKKRKSRGQYPPFGPYTSADPTLDGLKRADAILVNRKHLKDTLEQMAYANDTGRRSKHGILTGHKVIAPIVSMGDTYLPDAGRLLQRCVNGSFPECRETFWVTDPIDEKVLFDSDIPGKYFRIQAELDRWDNGYYKAEQPKLHAQSPPDTPEPDHPPRIITPQKRKRAPRPFPTLSPLRRSTPPVPSTSRLEDLHMNSEIKFNETLPVNLLVWIADHQTYKETTIYPREDGNVRLTDFRLSLGKVGIEQGNRIEVYNFTQHMWIPALWKTPFLVPYRGYSLLMRYADVSYPQDFDEILPHVTPPHYNSLPTPPNTVSKKGKERML